MRGVGLNPKLASLAYSTRTGKGTQITYGCEKQQGFCPSERDSWRNRDPLKGPTQKNSICSHLPWAPAQGGQSGLETQEESLELVALGRYLREQPPGSLC